MKPPERPFLRVSTLSPDRPVTPDGPPASAFFKKPPGETASPFVRAVADTHGMPESGEVTAPLRPYPL